MTNPTTKDIRLIDFSIASLLFREAQTLTNPNILEGTLAYLSPEQTGELTTAANFIPWVSLFLNSSPQSYLSNLDKPMELVYCHLAKLPPQLHT